MLIRAMHLIEGEYIDPEEEAPVPLVLAIGEEAEVTDAYGRSLIAMEYAEEVVEE